ncbi:MAG: SDR family oxidoreductase, partial [Proteobacteria bacterium]|nr:SDR family oxidoreductase [Pseudomonadota bacterium]
MTVNIWEVKKLVKARKYRTYLNKKQQAIDRTMKTCGKMMFDEVVPPDTELAERVAARVPVGRLGRPSDISRATKFFLADDADFITGQTLF